MSFHPQWMFAIGIVLVAVSSTTRGFELDERTNEIVIKTLAGFDKCVLDLSEIPACLQALRRHADKRPNDAFQAGKRALLHYEAWTALPFFEIAFRKRATDAQCEDEDVFRAVSEGLSRPSSDQTSIELARGTAAGRCWDSLQESLVEAAAKGGPRFKANVCRLLTSKGVTAAPCSTLSTDQPAAPADE